MTTRIPYSFCFIIMANQKGGNSPGMGDDAAGEDKIILIENK